ncbi:hypothetical protein B296_00027765 [Ensete ventricosum]|uniref:Uncharacterized protein n=1 Tax=Ensete ventricosum TaxID=4639 RepID=A0A426XHD7_ENSVE|nr:hypothetical protein B296_00027765 [Ensete ventricosum]
MRWDLVGSSLGDSPKESGISLGTQREIARKKTIGLATRLSEVAGVYRKGTAFVEISMGKPLVSNGWTARTTESEWQAVAFGG